MALGMQPQGAVLALHSFPCSKGIEGGPILVHRQGQGQLFAHGTVPQAHLPAQGATVMTIITKAVQGAAVHQRLYLLSQQARPLHEVLQRGEGAATLSRLRHCLRSHLAQTGHIAQAQAHGLSSTPASLALTLALNGTPDIATVHIGQQHRNAVTPRVLLEGFRRVEAHGLLVEDGLCRIPSG